MGKLPKINKEEEKKEIPIGARFRGPGPAAYTIKSTLGNDFYNGKKAPSYSFGVKTHNTKEDVTPGPNQFSPIALRNGVQNAPAYSMLGRNFPLKTDNANPGPASYYSNFYQSKNKAAPAYSLLGRNTEKINALNPSPASYSLKSKIGESSPAWTMHPKLQKKIDSISPGPAKYSSVNLNYIKKSSPAYSLYFRRNENDAVASDGSNKTNKKTVRLEVPGPGAYNVNFDAIKESSPGYSFRNKHSEFELPYPESPENFEEETF